MLNADQCLRHYPVQNIRLYPKYVRHRKHKIRVQHTRHPKAKLHMHKRENFVGSDFRFFYSSLCSNINIFYFIHLASNKGGYDPPAPHLPATTITSTCQAYIYRYFHHDFEMNNGAKSENRSTRSILWTILSCTANRL